MADLTYDTQDAVPEDLREHATAKDGKFVVSVAPSKKLDEFRTNNVNVSKERDSYANVLARLKTDVGLDTEKLDDFVTSFAELRKTQEQVEAGKLVKDTSLDEAVAKRTGAMKADYEGKINALTTANQNLTKEIQDLTQQVNNNVIDRHVTAAATDEKSGIRSDALNAVIREAREFFVVEDGKLVARDSDKNVIYGADGATPITPMEWIKTKLSQSAPYLFKESQGGGANGGGGGSGNLTAAQIAAMTPEQKMAHARAQNQNQGR